MAPAKTTRAKKFADWEEKPVRDYDPEADGPAQDANSSDDEDDATGTEHYVSVGKSKLRQKEPPALGPKYSGVRVSRAALDDSSDGESEDEESGSGDEEEESEEDDDDSQQYDDPEMADLERDNIIDDDDEIDSDEAFEAGEEEMFRAKGFSFRDSKDPATNNFKTAPNGRAKRRTAADFMSGSESEGDEDEDEDAAEVGGESDSEGLGAQLDESESEEGFIDDEAEESSGEQSSDQDSEDEDGEESRDEDMDDDEEMGSEIVGNDRSDLVKMMKEDHKTVVTNISQAAKADADKGVAVRQQRRTYDSLLNLRIRLQKGLVSVNSLSEATGNFDTDKQPYEAAEEAAIKLWNAVDGFRASLVPEQKAGQKRKRDIDTTTSNEELWEEMQATEQRATAKRKKVLEKWSTRVKNTTATVTKERQLGTAGSQSLVSVLESQLLNSERLVKRTHIPRSCAPLQASKKVAEDPNIYDDADFYQLLLKELIDQRTSDTGADGNGSGSVPTVRWTAIKEAKTRKQVDRRASKGRKLRFTVHEKLQNFMAPEDRRGWEEEAIDRLFGTLFGQRMQLKEEVSDDDDDMVAEEEGLKLFKS